MDNREDPFGFRPIWDAILEVYQEVARICDKHNLRYYAVGGTLLGAVRHHGFIPWDDDLDLMMPLEDYKRFREIAMAELPSHLKFVDRTNVKGYPNLFAKVADTRIDKLKALRQNTGLSLGQGIFVDIFILTGAPSTLCERIRSLVVNTTTNIVYSYRQNGIRLGNLRHFIVGICGFVLTPFKKGLKDFDSLLDAYWKELVTIPFERSSTAGLFYGMPTEKYIFTAPTSCFLSAKKMPFEDTEIPVIDGFDVVLSNQYGDYMSLPPIDKRIPHHSNQTYAPWLVEEGK